MMDYRCWNNHGEEGLNKAKMRNSYLEREVPTGVKVHEIVYDGETFSIEGEQRMK
jgi:hypothetical protein